MLDSPLGQELARWAIRIAVLCYVARVGLDLRNLHHDRLPPGRAVVWVWSLGCAMYLLHVFLAFVAFHNGSHAAAVEFTAIETERVVGVRRGEGVWVNYFLAVVWSADVIRLMRCRCRDRVASIALTRAVHGFFAVMMFSATVVFGPGYYRWLFGIVVMVWLAVWMTARRPKAMQQKN
ncbi:hypothetical protein [Stieleria varia]|uniref:Uncharacterized protein n=1 Tax=Stieleria varia TaxID=2528005 RepID=A0A5C6B4M9_9BACT|nr:hypothetical protein [Stieleria varia]TWU06259.1 hypothetical protein Pla52n_19800 [Stieleria varia]